MSKLHVIYGIVKSLGHLICIGALIYFAIHGDSAKASLYGVIAILIRISGG